MIISLLIAASTTGLIALDSYRNGPTVPKLYISSFVKNRLHDTNMRTEEIVGIQIVTLDFKENRRIETYMDIDQIDMNVVYKAFAKKYLTGSPLFNGDRRLDNRIIKILSGNFVCSPYRETTAYTYAPSLENQISTVCAASIPMSSIDTLGILTIYISGTFTSELHERMLNMSRDVTIQIYEDNKRVN